MFKSFDINNRVALAQHGSKFIKQVGSMSGYVTTGRDTAMKETAGMIVRTHTRFQINDLQPYKVRCRLIKTTTCTHLSSLSQDLNSVLLRFLKEVCGSEMSPECEAAWKKFAEAMEEAFDEELKNIDEDD